MKAMRPSRLPAADARDEEIKVAAGRGSCPRTDAAEPSLRKVLVRGVASRVILIKPLLLPPIPPQEGR